jgi:DNA-binding LacI/PurR family transcriptional regulator
MANELFKRGVRIPKDLSLLAFNNSFLCSSFNPPLTAISIDKVLMARKALELMSRSISGKAPCDPERFLIEPELVWRESVAEPN